MFTGTVLNTALPHLSINSNPSPRSEVAEAGLVTRTFDEFLLILKKWVGIPGAEQDERSGLLTKSEN
jgi:hypothetical protein